ncbi:hypothetical protein B484DRAFT_419795 [Ochromonadaceae sp. CCMP2298]|nr:hypothetical protein B484DRAFT_419795 [Ochromonadaceae sp. CCMP2298]
MSYEEQIEKREACDMVIVEASAEEGIRYKYRLDKRNFKLKDGEIVRGKSNEDGEVFAQDYDGRDAQDGMTVMISKGGRGPDCCDVGLALGGPLSWAELVGKIIVQENLMVCRKGRAEPTPRPSSRRRLSAPRRRCARALHDDPRRRIRLPLRARRTDLAHRW